MLAQKWQEVKREAAPPLPQTRKSPFLPRMNDGGGKALLGVKRKGPKGWREIRSASPVRMVKPAVVEPQFPTVNIGPRRSILLAATSS
jgi:hypothetical protein